MAEIGTGDFSNETDRVLLDRCQSESDESEQVAAVLLHFARCILC